MKIKYVWNRPREIIPATGAPEFVAEPGQVYEVDPETASSLLGQPKYWQKVEPQTEKKEAK